MFRLTQLPPELLLGVLLLLPLGSIGTIITLLPKKLKLVAVDAFEKKVLHQLRNGNAEFVIRAPSMDYPSRDNPSVRLLTATTENIPGEIKIHFTPTLTDTNEPMIFQLVSTICLQITQPDPQNPHGHVIEFKTAENLRIIPKKRIQWEILSTIRNTNMYKFKLDNEIQDNNWKNCFSKYIDIYIVAEFEDELYEVPDVYFLFADLFSLCMRLFIITIDFTIGIVWNWIRFGVSFLLIVIVYIFIVMQGFVHVDINGCLWNDFITVK